MVALRTPDPCGKATSSSCQAPLEAPLALPSQQLAFGFEAVVCMVVVQEAQGYFSRTGKL